MVENILEVVFLLVMEESVAVEVVVPKVDLLVDLVEDLQRIVVLVDHKVVVQQVLMVVLTLVVEVVVLLTHILVQEVVVERVLL